MSSNTQTNTPALKIKKSSSKKKMVAKEKVVHNEKYYPPPTETVAKVEKAVVKKQEVIPTRDTKSIIDMIEKLDDEVQQKFIHKFLNRKFKAPAKPSKKTEEKKQMEEALTEILSEDYCKGMSDKDFENTVDNWFSNIKKDYGILVNGDKAKYGKFRLSLIRSKDKKSMFHKVILNTSDFDLMDTGNYPKAVCFIGLGKSKNEEKGVRGRIYKAKDINAPYINGKTKKFDIRGNIDCVKGGHLPEYEYVMDASMDWLYSHTKKNKTYEVEA